MFPPRDPGKPRQHRYRVRATRQRPLAARLGLFIARAIAAVARAVYRLLRDAARELWRPVRRRMVTTVALATVALLGLGVLQAVREEPELMRPILAIGILVLALRFMLRLVRDSFKL